MAVDLEPSCWASSAADCSWPSSQDAANFRSFLNALAAALHDNVNKSPSRGHAALSPISDEASAVSDAASGGTQSEAASDFVLSVAAAALPTTQCDGGVEEHAMYCSDEALYLAQCNAGLWNVSVCNCCAFTTWFNLDSLCSSDANLVVRDALLHTALTWLFL